MAAETLYRDGRLSISNISERLHISRSTLYSYLRHRGVEIGPYKKSAGRPSSTTSGEMDNADQSKIATILLTLRIENNSKFVRGKKRTIDHVESFYLDQYNATRCQNGKYELKCLTTPTKNWMKP